VGEPQGVGQLAGRPVLEQVSGRPGPQGGEQVVVVARDGEHHDDGLGQVIGDARSGGDAAAGHVDVEQADVGPLADYGRDRRLAARLLSADHEAVPVEREPDAGADRLRGGDEDAQRRDRWTIVPAEASFPVSRSHPTHIVSLLTPGDKRGPTWTSRNWACGPIVRRGRMGLAAGAGSGRPA